MSTFKNIPIIAAHGRHYFAQINGEMIQCLPRGKKSTVAVGDYVTITTTAKGQAVIEQIEERTNLLYRSDQYKSKLLAANISQLLIVVATEPSFSDDLISRALLAAESQEIPVHLILNKIDLTASLTKAKERLSLYEKLGYPIYETSTLVNVEETQKKLLALISNQTSLLVGQSGMGKSSLVNLLIPDAKAKTREISMALRSGKHTTTFSRLYPLDEKTALIDSPGFQEFGLFHLKKESLAQDFREFRPYLGHCRFYNCQHITEPNCAILEAVKTNQISELRHALYVQLLHELDWKAY